MGKTLKPGAHLLKASLLAELANMRLSCQRGNPPKPRHLTKGVPCTARTPLKTISFSSLLDTSVVCG